MIISNNFSSIFIFGENKYINNFLQYINVCADIVIFDDYKYNIYKYGGIDFITIDLDDLDDIYKLNINNFIKKMNYLISNIIYLISYINRKDGQIIYSLSYNKINIILVSLMPTLTFDYYLFLCNYFNLKTYVFKDKNITIDDFRKIIKNLYDNKYYYIYDIFINLTII